MDLLIPACYRELQSTLLSPAWVNGENHPALNTLLSPAWGNGENHPALNTEDRGVKLNAHVKCTN